jgi:hypothetical protein
MRNGESVVPHSTTKLIDDRPVGSLDTLDEIAARYAVAGPHATVLMTTPVLGSTGDDLEIRWHANRTELTHLGASAATIAQLDRAMSSVTVHGSHLLLTANDDSVASSWISLGARPFSIVGSLPALVPAIREAREVVPVLAAVVDRAGADVYAVQRLNVDHVETVDGETDQIHKSGAGGWSHARRQRHSETIWARNASLVASAITRACSAMEIKIVFLSGDERAVRLVRSSLAPHHDLDVTVKRAGARGDGTITKRVRDSATEVRRAAAERHKTPLIRRLDEELGQHDRGIEGSVAVLEAINENRVRTLFIDIDEWTACPHVDATVKLAIEHGAEPVVAPLLGVRDGVAALLRIRY